MDYRSSCEARGDEFCYIIERNGEVEGKGLNQQGPSDYRGWMEPTARSSAVLERMVFQNLWRKDCTISSNQVETTNNRSLGFQNAEITGDESSCKAIFQETINIISLHKMARPNRNSYYSRGAGGYTLERDGYACQY
jgi:hypothetical protein